VNTFLATTPAFQTVHAAQTHPKLVGTLIDSRGHLRTQPHLHGLEAFFGAVFQRPRG
jgi:16S rRNA C967 or C1407 C5-methylase (RsmB/RsmF family)